jgi:hypothetical protein
MRTLRKEALETARKVKYVAGYDFLAAFDQNWHRSGYPCGIMNDFLELKPGECASDVLKYNGESVLLLDCGRQRTFAVGDGLRFDVLTSLYGGSALAEGTLSWYLADQTGGILSRGAWPIRNVHNGTIEKVGTLECILPELQQPTKATLFMELSGGQYELVNNWDFWVFPKFDPMRTGADADADILTRLGGRYPDLRPITSGQQSALRIVSTLHENTLDFLDRGGRALLLGCGPLPALPTSFQMSVTGRVRGNLATVIEDHPLLRRFPHDGYCDWQFHSMLEDGRAVNFNELAAPFDPIIEVVSSFKLVIKQANLFEWGIGKGGLLVSTMNVDPSVPANAYLLDVMIDYTRNKGFKPRNAVDSRTIAELIRAKPER